MSTHRPISGRKGSAHLSIVTGVGSLLIALQVWLALSSIAFAAPLAPQALTETTPYQLARAGVSVVRLLATYQPQISNPQSDKPTASKVVCTGLGVVVANWPTSTTGEVNTWILTDGYLVARDAAAPCLADRPNSADWRLQHVQVITSSFYNSGQVVSFEAEGSSLQLAECTACSAGSTLTPPVLIGLSNGSVNDRHLPADPYIDVAQNVVTGGSAIVLQQDNGNASTRPVLDDQEMIGTLNTFRSPTQPASTTELEPGTPLINQDGELTAIHLNGVSSLVLLQEAMLETALKSINRDATAKMQQNTVHTNWNEGLKAFYGKGKAKNLGEARAGFQKTFTANGRFEAASKFAGFSTAVASRGTESTSNSQADTNGSMSPLGLELWQIALLSLVVLLVLLAVVTILFRRSRARLQQRSGFGFTPEELAEAERDSTLLAQQFQAQEAMARQQAQQSPVPAAGAAMPGQVSPARELLCPNCNAVVPYDAKFCPQCRMWLSPSESGLHLRVAPQQSAAPPPSIAEMPTMPPPPAAVPVPVSQASLAEQPTMPAPLKSPTLAEQPTVEMKPNGTTSLDSEKTQPASRKSNGARLAFIVGSRSDPGIKRQYKPNEDSLFAAQGMIQAPQPQPFGLFVVADGLGGHANGQDASRLAIQMIIEYILPRLLKGGIASGDVYTHLLAEGIQNANQAVYQRNLDQQSDMGTTVTAALVVADTAYVANVGDSRTYLYRESSGGLTKITNDHSVVASLVEAGIIKPDDIYTHPKRSHIYRNLGEKAAVEVDTFNVPIQENDKLLLCSDGLWDMVRDPQIEEVIKAPQEPKMTSEALIQAAYAGGGEDNISVIVVQIVKASKAPRPAPLQILAMPDNFQMPQL